MPSAKPQAAVPVLHRRRVASPRRQRGELSMIEGGIILAAMALLALFATMGGHYVMDRVHASQFRKEAQMFHDGILDATSNDPDYSAETLTTLAQNHAFDAANTRLASDDSTLQGLFGGDVTVAPGQVTNPGDALVLTYPVPATVCSLSAAALANAYTQVDINGTTVYSPTVPFDSGTAATACASAGTTASIDLYTTHS